MTTSDARRNEIAQALWHRFANPSVETWEDETHKAEYLLAADDVILLASCYSPSLADFNRLISCLNYDGPDENSLTVGEIRRALPDMPQRTD